MAIDTTPSQVATNALQSIPFGSIIGSPLKACVEAQAVAAKSSWEFIKEVGLYTDPDTQEKKTVNVSFTFIKDGRMAQINVPLLTIVPIPYIAIKDIDINFKANISAESSTHSENSSSSEAKGDAELTAGLSLGPFSMSTKMNASYSSKKDSKATADSKYSVEYTMDVGVKATQDSMPAGLAKVLGMLGNAVGVSDPKGTLEVNKTKLMIDDGTEGVLIATFKNSEGLLDPKAININNNVDPAKMNIDGDNKIFSLAEGTYELTAGKQNIKIDVVKKPSN